MSTNAFTEFKNSYAGEKTAADELTDDAMEALEQIYMSTFARIKHDMSKHTATATYAQFAKQSQLLKQVGEELDKMAGLSGYNLKEALVKISEYATHTAMSDLAHIAGYVDANKPEEFHLKYNTDYVDTVFKDAMLHVAGQTNKMKRDFKSQLRKSTLGVMQKASVTGMSRQQVFQELKADLLSKEPDFVFTDKAGRNWKTPKYLKMLTHTVMTNTLRESYTNVLINEGHDLVKVSQHNAKDACKLWEGKVLSLTGATKGYPTVDDARATAQVFHPRCRHRLLAYHEDIDEVFKAVEQGMTDKDIIGSSMDDLHERLKAAQNKKSGAESPDETTYSFKDGALSKINEIAEESERFGFDEIMLVKPGLKSKNLFEPFMNIANMGDAAEVSNVTLKALAKYIKKSTTLNEHFGHLIDVKKPKKVDATPAKKTFNYDDIDTQKLADALKSQSSKVQDDMSNKLFIKGMKTASIDGLSLYDIWLELKYGDPINAAQKKALMDALAEDDTLSDDTKKLLPIKGMPKPEPVKVAKPKVVKEKPVVAIAESELKWDDFEQVGAQKGSNNGGVFVHKVTGEKFYLKRPKSDEIAANEYIAAKLYEKAGLKVPKLEIFTHPDGGKVIASKWEDGIRKIGRDKKGALKKSEKSKFYDGYVIDAWLANWDVVGMEYDNIMIDKDGKALRVDVGGSLLYRAQGSPKGSAFSREVSELDTFIDGTNRQSKEVFEDIKVSNYRNSFRALKALDESDIRELINNSAKVSGLDARTATKLADTLIERREYLLDEFKKRQKEWRKKKTEIAHVVREWGIDGFEGAKKPTPQDESVASNWIKKNESYYLKCGAAKQLRDDFPNLTELEAGLVIAYTNGIYRRLNESLRNNKSQLWTNRGYADQQALTKVLNSALGKLAQSKDKVLSRGDYNYNDPSKLHGYSRSSEYKLNTVTRKIDLDSSTKEAFIKEWAVGNETETWDFLSTAIAHDVWSGNVHLHLTLKEGRHPFVDKWSAHSGEMEVIVQAGARWKVTKVHDGRDKSGHGYHIYAEEI